MNRDTARINTDWLAGIAAPLAGAPCGEDPRYLEEFQQVKEEVDKLRDADYQRIMTACRTLLTATTKDLRIAGYHLLAAAYVEGLPGLADGLKAYRILLQRFWEECHPRNETPRLAALKLLDTPRILAFAEQQPETDRETLETLQEEILQIDAFLVKHLGDEVPRLTGLARWVAGRLHNLEAVAPPPDVDSAPSAERSFQYREVHSEQGVETLTRQIHGYLLDNRAYLRAMAYSRALRWGNLSLPPHEDGRTRVPAPRGSGLAELQNALVGTSLDEALTCCEQLFFEPGFPLLLDLQFQAHEYLETHQRPDLAGYIRNAVHDLVERHPQLPDLKFDDGSSFAGSACRQWLQQSRTAAMGESPAQSLHDQTGVESTAAVFDQAMQLARRKKLPEALQKARTLPAATDKQRVRQRLAEARLCLAAGKPAMAEVVLAEIQNEIRNHHLATWDPALAIEILQERLTALAALGKGDGEDSQHRAQQAREVRQSICQIDLVAAATLL